MRHRTHVGICTAISTVVIGLAPQRASTAVVFEQVETATTNAFTGSNRDFDRRLILPPMPGRKK